MPSWTAVSRTEHAKSYWRPRNGFEFAATEQVVPIILAELPQLLPHYILGFLETKNNIYQPIALVGLGGGRNLYITAEYKWLCSYVPSALRSYPFALHQDPSREDGNAILCIDESSISNDETFPRLFREDGELAEKAAGMLNFVTQCKQNQRLTTIASAALASAGVIEPWPVCISRGEGEEPFTINGMYRINETALNTLDGEVLASLRASGALALAYAQLFSIAQIGQLTKRAEYLLEGKAHAPLPPGLTNLFNNEDSGSLNFDALDLDKIDTENQ